MNSLRRATTILVCSLLAVGIYPAFAQDSDQTTTTTTTSSSSGAFAKDRLFLEHFEFDGEIIPGQWWEADLTFTSHDRVDATTINLLAALQPWQNIEVGGRVGFGTTDASGGLSDGSGATDLDLWAKWRVGSSSPDTDISIGAEITVPTGDDTAGLGTDAFALAFFGALRQQMQNSVLTAYAGVQFNDNGQIFGARLEGRTAGLMGVAVMVPLANTVTFVGEANLTTERFDDTDSDFAIRGGVNWHVSNRGAVRPALELGITDGAPDWQFLVGYAHTF
jgi:hypothetical protein